MISSQKKQALLFWLWKFLNSSPCFFHGNIILITLFYFMKFLKNVMSLFHQDSNFWHFPFFSSDTLCKNSSSRMFFISHVPSFPSLSLFNWPFSSHAYDQRYHQNPQCQLSFLLPLMSLEISLLIYSCHLHLLKVYVVPM